MQSVPILYAASSHSSILVGIIPGLYYSDGNNDDYRAGAKLDVTEEDACTADVSAPKLPPKPQPQVE